METEKILSWKGAEKDFCGKFFFCASVFPISNAKTCLGVIVKAGFFYRLSPADINSAGLLFIQIYSAVL